MISNPLEQMKAGVRILEPLLNQHGFRLGDISHGTGSGGDFAQGEFIRGERRLELHYRGGLGLVIYRVESATLDHLTYMKLLQVIRQCAFASLHMADDLQGFTLLADDMRRYAADFLAGDGLEFRSLARKFQNSPTMFSGIPE